MLSGWLAYSMLQIRLSYLYITIMDFKGRGDIEEALGRVGQLLAAEGHEYAIVVLGGAALDLLGIVDRDTGDVDILAFAKPRAGHEPLATTVEEPPYAMPEPLRRAARTISRDLELDENWLNTAPGLQWRTGLPPGLAARIRWRRYAALWVGLVDRYDLVFFKLFAAADSSGSDSVHYQDLIALRPSAGELADAAAWTETQDASSEFAGILKRVVDNARKDLGLE